MYSQKASVINGNIFSKEKKLAKYKYKYVLHETSKIAIFVASLMIFPIIVALIYGEYRDAIVFLISSLSTLFFGFILLTITKKNTNENIGVRYSGVIVVFGWVLVIIISSFPMMFCTGMNFSQSFFESSSGWGCVGISLVDFDKIQPSHAIFIWRSIMQAISGIGVIFLLQILSPNSKTTMLYNSEGHGEIVLPNIKKTLRTISIIYFGYIIIGVVLYVICGMPVFDAINHSMTAVSTAGFSTKAQSIGYYNSISIELVSIFLMIAGSVNFSFYLLLLSKRFLLAFKFFENRVYFVILLLACPLVVTLGFIKPYTSNVNLRCGIFNTISALSTTGFSIGNNFSYNNGVNISNNSVFGLYSSFGILLIIICMLIGGQSGSTAGGIKSYRVGIMFKSFYWSIRRRVIESNKVYNPYVHNSSGKWYVSKSDEKNIVSFVLIYLVMFFVGALFISAFGYNVESSLFEVASALSSAGFSLGVSSLATPKPIIWLLSIYMIFARLESVVILLCIGKLIKDFSVQIGKIKHKFFNKDIKIKEKD